MKIYAFYLPQFHRIPENDKWWGEGFTEWTAVKGAVPLFEGHNQPRIPLDQKYYDLMDKDTMMWQASLMKQYGIDGICMYHYWFEGGKRLLEKPEQNLLQWTDVDMEFCLCWANESWARTWSKIPASNSWFTTSESKSSAGDDGLLIRQGYGDKNDWERHFEYLLPFFKDSRYVRHDEKPVFMIYRAYAIDDFDKMAECWNRLAQENGLVGIYFIGANMRDYKHSGINAGYSNASTEPLNSTGLLKSTNKLVKVDYERLWEQILLESRDYPMYYSALCGFDNTPRKGNKGRIIYGSTPEKFGHYLSKLMYKSHLLGREFVLIHAWNEWGEGMYLEPDTENGYKYLEAVKQAKSAYRNEKSFLISSDERICELLYEERHDKARIQDNLEMMMLWNKHRIEGINVEQILLTLGVKTISIYGFGIIGRLLYEELNNSEIEIVAVVDRMVKNAEITIYRSLQTAPQSDLTIVTVALEHVMIKRNLESLSGGKVCTFKELLMGKVEV